MRQLSATFLSVTFYMTELPDPVTCISHLSALSCLYPQLMSERDELAATVDRLQTDRDHLAESHSSTSTDLSDRQSEIHDLCEQVS